MSIIDAVPPYPAIGKKEYMERLEPFIAPTKMNFLRVAYALSKEAHSRQKRDDGHRYFDHVRACSWIAVEELQLHDPELHITLLLHDIIEDTYLLTVGSIELIFGERTSIMVNLLTHHQDVSTQKFVNRLRESARARVIGAKLIDRLHNLRTLGCYPKEKRQHKAMETLELYLPMAQQLVDNVKPQYRWRAEYLRDQVKALSEYWLTATS